MMVPVKKISINVFLGYLVLTIVAVVTSVTGIYIAKKIENTPSQQVQQAQVETLKVMPSQYPDYDAIKGKNKDPKIKQVNITKDCPPGGCISKKPAYTNFDDINKKYSVKGKFSRVYLYIEALVDYSRPLTSWDDIYFKLNDRGGHLIPEGNVLSTPPGDTSTYLYDMRMISYYPTLENKMKKTSKHDDFNMFELLGDGSTIKIVAAISSNRPGRVMKEFSIYYECYEGSECSITEAK